MQIHVGCRFKYSSTWPTPAIVQVQPRGGGSDRRISESWQVTPDVPLHTFHDLYDNASRRLVIPTGDLEISYDALVEISGQADVVAPEARQLPVDELPDETLHFTLPSRYCLSDVLVDQAWQLFGDTEPGWARVQAICNWVHGHIRFAYGSSTALTSAADVFERRVGVCRDFAHLAITFCRALNIPARYVFGYLPDIGVPPPDAPMDFCAWMEVFLGGRWYTFDPRNNMARVGHIVIGRGRDALDVAMITTFGAAELQEMIVWADQTSEPAGTVAARAAQ